MGALDQVLCFLIAIIHCVFDEEVKPLIRYTLSVIPVVIVFMYVESGRRRGLMVSIDICRSREKLADTMSSHIH